MNHGCRDVQSHFIVAYQSPPQHQPTEGALDDPTARQRREALLAGEPTDDLDHEV